MVEGLPMVKLLDSIVPCLAYINPVGHSLPEQMLTVVETRTAESSHGIASAEEFE